MDGQKEIDDGVKRKERWSYIQLLLWQRRSKQTSILRLDWGGAGAEKAYATRLTSIKEVKARPREPIQ